ncbi:MAG: NfeD family protein [Actinomycetota bacterium]
MTILGIIVAFVFFDQPWTAIIIGGFALFEAFEIFLWLKWRNRRSITGPESLIGMKGRALGPCDPQGQVRVKGQIWRASGAPEIGADDEIVVTAVDGNRLEVEPALTPADPGAPSG